MKNNAILIGVLFLVPLMFTGSSSGAANLVIEEAEFDFGYVPQNSKVSHLFFLHNGGEDPLVIERVVPGCGCTRAPLKKSELAPGETTELEIIFSTKQN